MKNIIKIIMVIIGTIIGAGFASGKEIYNFFFIYGKYGFFGIILTGILNGIIIYKTLIICKNNNINNYEDFLKIINYKYPKLNEIIKTIVIFFLIFSFYIMVAGFSSYMKLEFNINKFISAIIFLIITYFILNKNIQGLLKINIILVPFIILLIIYLGINSYPDIMQNMWKLEIKNNFKWILDSLIYTSYNAIILIPILISLKKYIKNKKELIFISFISLIIIILLALFIFICLLSGNIYIKFSDMPMIEVVKKYGNIIKYLYGLVIIVAIFTSTISTGYSLLENISKNKKEYNKYLILLCISAIFISNIGFSNLVTIVYPIFGLFGLIQVFYISKNNVYLLEKKLKN